MLWHIAHNDSITVCYIAWTDALAWRHRSYTAQTDALVTRYVMKRYTARSYISAYTGPSLGLVP